MTLLFSGAIVIMGETPKRVLAWKVGPCPSWRAQRRGMTTYIAIMKSIPKNGAFGWYLLRLCCTAKRPTFLLMQLEGIYRVQQTPTSMLTDREALLALATVNVEGELKKGVSAVEIALRCIVWKMMLPGHVQLRTL